MEQNHDRRCHALANFQCSGMLATVTITLLQVLPLQLAGNISPIPVL